MKKKYFVSIIISIVVLLIFFGSYSITKSRNDETELKKQSYIDYKKYTGKGIKIAILDSGIDLNHPDLKNNIIGGYDFVEDKPIYKDGDTRRAHGTNVAGIAAGNGRIQGVSKEASILAYRVVTQDREKFYRNVVEAIKKAVVDKASVINISAGIYNYKNGDELEQEIINARSKGIIVVKSNGNTGPELWSTNNLACSENVISVGNSTNIFKKPILKGETEEVGLELIDYLVNFPENEELIVLKNSYKENTDNLNLKNKVIILKANGNELIDKQNEFTNLIEKVKRQGCNGVIFLGGDKSKLSLFLGMGIPIAMVNIDNLDKFNNILKSDNYKLVSKMSQEIFIESSRGPGKNSMLLKPDLVAPGTQILCATMSSIDESGYVYSTGTSMSAPYVSGTIALLKEVHNDWSYDEIKAAMLNNATLIKDENNKYFSVLSQGSGAVNIEKAISSNTFVICDNLSFQLYENDLMTKTSDIEIRNLSNKRKTYNIYFKELNDFLGIKIKIPKIISVAQKSSRKFSMSVEISHKTPKGIYEGILFFKDTYEEKHMPFIILVN